MLTEPAPKPDRLHGEPRPPQAPVEPDWTPFDNARDVTPDSPPEGRGPALEWFHDTKSTKWGMAGLGFLAGVLFLCLKDWGFDWMRVWWLWLIIAAGSSLFLFGRGSTGATAGSDWLSTGTAWVDTYRLTKIKVSPALNTYHVHFTDNRNREYTTQLYYLQKNRELWDLVYNGILHSIRYNNADVNRRAVEHLELQGAIRKPPIGR